MKNRLLGWKGLVVTLALSIGLMGCGGGLRVQGAGATFPNPLYQKWFSEYNKLNADVRFDYQSIGSGGGIRQIMAGTVDFGGTDAPMNEEELRSAPGELLHIPTVIGADVLTYNLPGVSVALKLTPEAIAAIYLGKARRWSDQVIRATNQEVNLPDNEITVVYRSDGSGTTYVFTDYLSKMSEEWSERVGRGTSVSWPVGVGAKGNEGVTGQVKQTPFSIGYVELVYAVQNRMPVARVRNAAGAFVDPALESITAAAAGAAGSMPDDLRVSITNAPGEKAYPISAFTYLLVYREQQDEQKGAALVDFLSWAIDQGQALASEMGYAPLPPEVVERTERKIELISHRGSPYRRGT